MKIRYNTYEFVILDLYNYLLSIGLVSEGATKKTAVKNCLYKIINNFHPCKTVMKKVALHLYKHGSLQKLQIKYKHRNMCVIETLPTIKNKSEKTSFFIGKAPLIKPFYESRKWRSLRLEVLLEQGRKCCVCGRSPKNGIVLHVNHIKPRSKYPELELVKSNLQVLCEDCNLGKSNYYEEDWRI